MSCNRAQCQETLQKYVALLEHVKKKRVQSALNTANHRALKKQKSVKRTIKDEQVDDVDDIMILETEQEHQEEQ
jgi:hypothetical protein